MIISLSISHRLCLPQAIHGVKCSFVLVDITNVKDSLDVFIYFTLVRSKPERSALSNCLRNRQKGNEQKETMINKKNEFLRCWCCCLSFVACYFWHLVWLKVSRCACARAAHFISSFFGAFLCEYFVIYRGVVSRSAS